MTTELKKPELIIQQLNTLEEVFSVGTSDIDLNIANCVDNNVLRSIRQVVTSGDGDSFFASIAAEVAFNRLTNVNYFPWTAMKFLAYGIDQVNSFSSSKTLAVGISASGGSTRVIEGIERIKSSSNIDTLGLVGKAKSKLAEVTKFVLSAELIDHGRSPGIRTYLGSLIGLYLLSIRIGEVQNTISLKQSDHLRSVLARLGDYVNEIIETSRKNAGVASEICKESPMMSFVGSGPSYGTAMFSGAKVVEAAGKFVASQDLEEWGHIERFSYPLNYPVFMIAPPGNSNWRAIQLANAVTLLGHPLIAVVGDKDKEISKVATVVFQIPQEVDEFFSPLLYFIPATYLAYQLAVDLGRGLLQTDNEYVNSIRDELNKQTKIL